MSKDKVSIDIQEALNNNLGQLIPSCKDHTNRESINDLMGWVAKEYSDLVSDCPVILLDSALQLDGAFFKFCSETKVETKNLIMDAVSVLPYKDNEYDPFIVHGLFRITTQEFSFVKCYLLYEGSETPSSFILIGKNDYSKYSALKQEYSCWLRKREGANISVVNGEDYVQEVTQTWQELFFGENAETSKDIQNFVATFYSSKEFYNEAKVPWNCSMLISGEMGSGKTSIIDTVIAENDVMPVTINYYSLDDAVLGGTFKILEDKHKVVLFLEDVDELINNDVISAENLVACIARCKANDGCIIIVSCRKVPDYLKEHLFVFDFVKEMPKPEYDKVLDKLFGKHLTKANIDEVKAICVEKALSYGYLGKLYKMFIKSLVGKPVSKKKDANLVQLKEILKFLLKDHQKENMKGKTKKLGILANHK